MAQTAGGAPVKKSLSQEVVLITAPLPCALFSNKRDSACRNDCACMNASANASQIARAPNLTTHALQSPKNPTNRLGFDSISGKHLCTETLHLLLGLLAKFDLPTRPALAPHLLSTHA